MEKMIRVRIEKHWRGEEVNGKHGKGEVKGLRKDCACLITEIIICNCHPPATRVAMHGRISQERKKRGGQRQKLSFQSSSHLSSHIR